MKVTLTLTESIFDCKIKISDSQGERYYYISALGDEAPISPSVLVEVFDSDFDLTLIPMAVNAKPALDELEVKDWKDKLVKKAAGFLVSSVNKVVLRVGCCCRAKNVRDGDTLTISLQGYVHGNLFLFDLLDLYPVMYMFYEAFGKDGRFIITDAFEDNRKEFLKVARGVTLASGIGIGFIFTLLFVYPIQIGRVKRLTKNKKIAKKLIKFSNLSEKKRQRFLEKQEKFMDK